jgi:hypothetical protein
MSKLGKKMIAGTKEAVAIVRVKHELLHSGSMAIVTRRRFAAQLDLKNPIAGFRFNRDKFARNQPGRLTTVPPHTIRRPCPPPPQTGYASAEILLPGCSWQSGRCWSLRDSPTSL